MTLDEAMFHLLLQLLSEMFQNHDLTNWKFKISIHVALICRRSKLTVSAPFKQKVYPVLIFQTCISWSAETSTLLTIIYIVNCQSSSSRKSNKSMFAWKCVGVVCYYRFLKMNCTSSTTDLFGPLFPKMFFFKNVILKIFLSRCSLEYCKV